ncbi:hypothetical protein [Roseomonas sp. USHLN139]|uniref:hypothetical protein n=1 Tax=Roseomonas sp. USHLN139 TaxID=3081298 RepID=UPI003B012A1A
MPSRSAAERLFLMLEQDVRLRTLPAAAQLIWMKLMRLAAAAGQGGLLVFGSEIGFSHGFLVSVSLAVSHTQTETETALETLAARNLIEILPDESGLVMPGVRAATERSNINRNNALRGGRPRKGETAEDARRRRQGELMLPISGGLAETEKTEPKPTDGNPTTTTERYISTGGSNAREVSGDAALAQDLASIAGIALRLISRDLRVIADWRAAGVSVEAMRQTVRDVASRPAFDATRVQTLGYFTRAIRRAAGLAESGEAPAAAPVVENPPRPAPKERDEEGYTREERELVDKLFGLIRGGAKADNQARIRLTNFLKHCHKDVWARIAPKVEEAA